MFLVKPFSAPRAFIATGTGIRVWVSADARAASVTHPAMRPSHPGRSPYGQAKLLHAIAVAMIGCRIVRFRIRVETDCGCTTVECRRAGQGSHPWPKPCLQQPCTRPRRPAA